jgi:hypothetical protein
MLKSILLDTNPILLAVTCTVSILHTVFDFLAFKNDISFWRKVRTHSLSLSLSHTHTLHTPHGLRLFGLPKGIRRSEGPKVRAM